MHIILIVLPPQHLLILFDKTTPGRSVSWALYKPPVSKFDKICIIREFGFFVDVDVDDFGGWRFWQKLSIRVFFCYCVTQ